VLPLAEKKPLDHFQPIKMLKFQRGINLLWNFLFRTGSWSNSFVRVKGLNCSGWTYLNRLHGYTMSDRWCLPHSTVRLTEDFCCN